MPIPVAYLITELSVGGAQSALLRLLRGINRKRFVPSVGCLFYGDGASGEAIRTLGIPVFDAGMHRKTDWRALCSVFHWLKVVRPIILHTSLFHANLIGRIVGRLAQVPIVLCSERTMAMEASWRYLLNRLTIGMVDGVIAVSENVRDFCITQVGLPQDKMFVIYNGVETETASMKTRGQARQELGLPLDALVVGAVLRLESVKGVDDLLRAFARVEVRHPVWLAIVGDGTEREALFALSKELGIAQRVFWAGQRNQASRLIPAFDLFVQPSRHEGMPNAVLEAMASALPIVATAVGGTPEVVVDGESGLLVPAGDLDAMAAAITRLLGDVELRHRMGQIGKQRVERFFSVEQMVLKTEQLYTNTLQKKGLFYE